MSSEISQFISALKGGGARPNRFEVIIDFPAFAGGADEIRSTAFLCQSTSLPGSNLGITEVPFRGRIVKLAGDRTFEDWEATFYNDTDFALRDAFEAWSNAINQYNSNTGLVAPDEYFSTVSVYQLGNNDQRLKEYTMRYAFPPVVAPVELSADSNDQVEIFSVTFAYSDIVNGQNT